MCVSPWSCSGQDSEHEVARCAAPLLFSFSDRDANPMVVARVGSQLHSGSQAQVGWKSFIYVIFILISYQLW